MAVKVIAFFHALITVWNKTIFHKAKIFTNDIIQSKLPINNRWKKLNNVKQKGKVGIKTMKLLRYEQETVINYNAGEQTATVYTRDKAVMRKLDTLAVGFPDTYILIRQDEVSRTYSFPKSYISYRKPRRLSVEQREKARERMRKINLDDI